GNLYLKTYRAAGLEQTVRELKQRVAELESVAAVRGAALETRSGPPLMEIDEITRDSLAGKPQAVNDLPVLGKDRERPCASATGFGCAASFRGLSPSQAGRLRPVASRSPDTRLICRSPLEGAGLLTDQLDQIGPL